jgi:hypothetical protein
MSHAEGGVFSKAVQDLLSEVKTAQAEMQTQDTQKAGGSSAAFSSAMDAVNGVQNTHAVQAVQGSDVVKQLGKVEGSTHIGQTAREEESALSKLLKDVMKGQDAMSEVMDRALSGVNLDSGELIKMQATIYHYTQELDLASKVVDKASSGIKQTMNTQV